ncbi:HepT-like ribonuclease domain-containing protein [Frankia canadensis]|nr:HepT-like ribonuclease domain-containing protein [Frankia canadensis]
MPWRSVTGFRNIAVHTYFGVQVVDGGVLDR